MRKIILACVAGMSTSMLVKKMREAAAEEGYGCEIAAFPVNEIERRAADADLVLLGPQVKFQLAKVKSQVSCPVAAIEMADYGRMNGKAVLAKAKGVLGD